MRTQGEIEAAICEGISRFEQEYMGRGPKDVCLVLLHATWAIVPVAPLSREVRI
jgi:uncharacterized protein YbcI